MAAALEPDPSQERIEGIELGVRLDFDIEPVGGQAGRRGSKLHQPLHGAIRHVVSGSTVGEMFPRTRSCDRLSAQRTRAALATMLFQAPDKSTAAEGGADWFGAVTATTRAVPSGASSARSGPPAAATSSTSHTL